MNLVATILAGPGCAPAIEGAVRSVIDWADQVVVIDTADHYQTGALDFLRPILGGKGIYHCFGWTGSFADARNAALAVAYTVGGDWAVTCDVDERLVLHGEPVRQFLEMTPCDTLMVTQADGTYAKERFFRLPATGEWVGDTHEFFDRIGKRGTLPQMRFTELSKTEEQLQAKHARDLNALREMICAEPAEARWHYYFGQTKQALGDLSGAISAYRKCAGLTTWHEQGAWAMYKATECWDHLGDHAAMKKYALDGLLILPTPELAWVAGLACYRLSQLGSAIAWSRVAIEWAGDQSVARDGFREPKAWAEGPYDVLRHAYRDLGNLPSALGADARYSELRDARLGIVTISG
jgi:hypothetical protein